MARLPGGRLRRAATWRRKRAAIHHAILNAAASMDSARASRKRAASLFPSRNTDGHLVQRDGRAVRHKQHHDSTSEVVQRLSKNRAKTFLNAHQNPGPTAQHWSSKRRRSESNRRWEICSLLPYHLATAPCLHFTDSTAMYRTHPSSGSNPCSTLAQCVRLTTIVLTDTILACPLAPLLTRHLRIWPPQTAPRPRCMRCALPRRM